MPSVTRSIPLIELLARRGPLGVRALAQALALPLGSARRMVTDLAADSIVERTGDGEWELSFRLLEIVGIQLDHLQLPRLARPVLEQFASQTREMCFLAVPSGDEIVYLDKAQPDLQLQLNVELGTRRPMHCTGLGKVILAYQPAIRREQLLTSSPLRAYTPFTITDPVLLRLELERTRARGYALDHQEIILGVHCVAVPILNHAGRPVGAISVAGTTPKSESDHLEALVSRMKSAADHLSRRLGFIPTLDPPAVDGDRRGSTPVRVSILNAAANAGEDVTRVAED